MKYYIIAGEASGDLHGSNLIKEIKKEDPSAVIRCWGGDLMQVAGGEVIKHYRDLAFMGFTEVLKHLGTILNNISFCKEDIERFKPDALVFVDYPGFNLRIAKWAKPLGYKTIYYISPQAWAWKENRVKTIKECVDKMLVILPFEKQFYEKWNYEVAYVGHPLIEVINDFTKTHTPIYFGEKPVIALLPGSRKQEITKKLPIMLQTAKHFSAYTFVVAKAPGLDPAFYDDLMKGYENVSSISGNTYGLLMHAKAALVTSGTATLETALFGVPEIVCYKSSSISYKIAKRIIKVPYISLVNLIMNKMVVKELIQEDLNIENITKELEALLTNENRIAAIQSDYTLLKQLLSQGGNASANAAKITVDYTING